MFFLVEPGGDRSTATAARRHRKERGMNLRYRHANRPGALLKTAIALAALWSSLVLAQAPPVALPSVNVSASATATVSNDRLQAWLRTEAENVSPAVAAAQVNAASAQAMAEAKAVPGVKVATLGYSTQPLA